MAYIQIRRILQVLLIVLFTLPLALKGSGVQDRENSHLLGISMTTSEQASVTRQQLEALEQMGISILEVTGYAPEAVLDFIDESDLFFFVRQERYFVTAYHLSRRDSLFYQEDLSLIRYYSDRTGKRPAAFGLFAFPHDRTTASAQLFNRYVERFSLPEENEYLLYYLSAYPRPDTIPASFSFRSIRLSEWDQTSLPSPVIHFGPAGTTKETLKELRNLFESLLEMEQSIILLPYSWVKHQTERFEPFKEALKAYSQKREILFPLPKSEEHPVSANWLVAMLILLAGSYMVHYRFSSIYRNILFRYFLMHKFFVENIIEYRLRTLFPGAILFFQHVFIVGLTSYLFAVSTLSPLGMEAIFHTFPTLGLFGNGAPGFFMFGIFISLVLQSLSLLWIHLINRTTRLYQALALYCWPLQLNLPIVITMTALYHAGGAEGWIEFMSLLVLVVWFFSFNIAALDIARILDKYRILYILFTVGLYVLLMVIFITILLFYPPISEPLSLALTLP